MPAFYRNTGGTNTIVFMCLPRPLGNQMFHSSPLRRVSRELQIIPSARPADHLLIMTKTMYAPSYSTSTPRAKPHAWDRDLLMRCLRRGERRAEFAQALRRRLEADENALTDLLEKSTAD
eukprot:6086926-Pyramimonas_sp.AAC.1